MADVEVKTRHHVLKAPHPLIGIKPQRLVHDCGGTSFELAVIDVGGQAKIKYLFCKKCGRKRDVDDASTIQADAKQISPEPELSGIIGG